MNMHLPRSAPSMAVAATALFVALGGTGYAASTGPTGHGPRHHRGQPSGRYLQARHFAYSHGEKFFNAGQTVTLGRNGHFTFTATCSKDKTGQNQVSFDVTADTTADLDGQGLMPAGKKVNIHINSDAMDTMPPQKPLNPGDFDQVASASSSTEISPDGEEVDVFYNDGVNWPAGNGSRAHDCFAGYTGFAAGFNGSSQS